MGSLTTKTFTSQRNGHLYQSRELWSQVVELSKDVWSFCIRVCMMRVQRTPHQLGMVGLSPASRFLVATLLPHPSRSSDYTGRHWKQASMSTTSAPAMRHTLRSCASPLRSQKRWAQVHDVRFVATHQDTNKVINRYKEKLVQKAKE